MSVSMTMNGAVLPVMAFFIVAGEEQGVASLGFLKFWPFLRGINENRLSRKNLPKSVTLNKVKN